jgi:hypothetical protein
MREEQKILILIPLYIVANHKIVLMVVVNKELKVAFENKVYLETYYHHRPSHAYRWMKHQQQSKYNNYIL